MSHAKEAAERIVYGPRRFDSGDSLSFCQIAIAGESAVDLIARETQGAIDAATAELREELITTTRYYEEQLEQMRQYNARLRAQLANATERYEVAQRVSTDILAVNHELRAEVAALKHDLPRIKSLCRTGKELNKERDALTVIAGYCEEDETTTPERGE